MAKNAVYSVKTDFNLSNDPWIKRVALGFDTIYIQKPLISFTEEELSDPEVPSTFAGQVRKDRALYEYLLEEKIISFFDNPFVSDNNVLDNAERNLLDRSVSHILQMSELQKQLERITGRREMNELMTSFNEVTDKASDALTRLKAIGLAKRQPGEFYPILRSERSFDQDGTKTAVVRLVVNNLP